MPGICLIGEAWGAEEARQRAPFVGPSGWELNRMLQQAGIRRSDCYLTNVFNLQPKPSNDITNLCGPREHAIPGRGPIALGRWVRAEFAPELDRLNSEISRLKPNLIIALGGTAAWATIGDAKIGAVRGRIASSSQGFKVLPTYHPAAVMREWSLRSIAIMDLVKAKYESAFPEIRRPHRQIYIPETVADLDEFYDRHLTNADVLTVDIETAGTEITCIGFAPSTSVCLVVPFTDSRRAGRSYWATAGDEFAAWLFVRRVLSGPARKLFQNGVYDMHFLYRSYRIKTMNASDDTMLLHHALQPELQKGLGFLGSVYTNEAAWKQMRQRGKTTIKRDE